MTDLALTVLKRQYDTAWKLAAHHLTDIGADEWAWRPAAKGLHVVEEPGGLRGEWPEREDYDIGPPSLPWLVWHIGFWWAMALDRNFGDATLTRDSVVAPRDVDAAIAWIHDLDARWRRELDSLSDADLSKPGRWPYEDRPLADVVAWATVELVKNASEIGYVRFLYGVRDRQT
ncbi:MAG TPA: DinB family protein [Caulobacteraceae bacterium]|jgi:hypothetical protein